MEANSAQPLQLFWGWESEQTFLGTVGYKNRGMTKHFLMTMRKFEGNITDGSFLIE